MTSINHRAIIRLEPGESPGVDIICDDPEADCMADWGPDCGCDGWTTTGRDDKGWWHAIENWDGDEITRHYAVGQRGRDRPCDHAQWIGSDLENIGKQVTLEFPIAAFDWDDEVCTFELEVEEQP